MSQANDLKVIRAATRAWNEGDAGSFMHPEIEWTTPTEVPGGGTLVGAEATAEFLRNFGGTMGVLNLSFEIQEIIPAGDEYLLISLAEGTSESGVAIPAHSWFHLLKAEDGKVRRAELFLDRRQAFEASGLQE